ncbi:MAG: DUF4124 domain-containing protein [Gammaproteobacteria bacterium]|nr:DUF4124 domain-containing protein [Gammaproteobacteria bacterium]
MRFFPFITILILSVCLASPLQAGRLYKWVDDEGRIHYSDRLPPADSIRPHAQLDERGITVGTVGAAKTADQIRQEEEVERLRQERQKLIDEQKAADRVLLRTFRSEDDIILTRDGQLQAVDSYIKITQSNIKRLKLKLEQMQRDAAAKELSGRRVSDRFQKEIEGKYQALKEAYESIVNREHDKDRIRKSFAQDLQRFRELKQLEESNDPMQEAEESFVEALKNVYICPDDKCHDPWSRAKVYMREHNTTSIKMDAENVLMGGMALKHDDISITLTRIRDSKREQTLVFLDVQCEDSPQGLKYCAGKKVEGIRQGFQAAVAEPPSVH